jgi:hypothetical protein
LPKKLYLGLSLVIIVIVGLVVILGIKQPEFRDVVERTPIPTLLATKPSLAALSTIEAERTAIAIFTQNPTLALSSTPFYAQIIYDDVMRNLTEIPLPKRPCYLSPTNVPQNLAMPITECGPFIATMMLGDEPRKIMAIMEKVGIKGTVGVESYGLEGINQSDNELFVAVQSRVGVLIHLNTISDQQLINDTLKRVTDILIENWEPVRHISTNAKISIAMSDGSRNKSILTTYMILNEAYKNHLENDALVQSLGGLTDGVGDIFKS